MQVRVCAHVPMYTLSRSLSRHTGLFSNQHMTSTCVHHSSRSHVPLPGHVAHQSVGKLMNCSSLLRFFCSLVHLPGMTSCLPLLPSSSAFATTEDLQRDPDSDPDSDAAANGARSLVYSSCLNQSYRRLHSMSSQLSWPTVAQQCTRIPISATSTANDSDPSPDARTRPLALA